MWVQQRDSHRSHCEETHLPPSVPRCDQQYYPMCCNWLGGTTYNNRDIHPAYVLQTLELLNQQHSTAHAAASALSRHKRWRPSCKQLFHEVAVGLMQLASRLVLCLMEGDWKLSPRTHACLLRFKWSHPFHRCLGRDEYDDWLLNVGCVSYCMSLKRSSHSFCFSALYETVVIMYGILSASHAITFQTTCKLAWR